MLARSCFPTLSSACSWLLAVSGVGYDSAAALLIAVGDNSDRMKNQASFAALCGVSPVEFSSGQTQKRRLNRGGNRQANAALYRIVLTRLRWDLATQEYLKKSEPKTVKASERPSVASNATSPAKSLPSSKPSLTSTNT